MDGILWILRTVSPWRDLPKALGPWATVWDLFDTWNHDGTLHTIPDRLRSQVERKSTRIATHYGGMIKMAFIQRYLRLAT
ncbi:MAG: transposase [Planctomycetes bacterium]|nr:transposase [Planctomycetota bacterium]